MKKIILLAIVILGFVSSCDETIDNEPYITSQTLTKEEQNQIEVMKQTQSILGSIISDDKVRRDIIDGAKSKYGGDFNANLSQMISVRSSNNSRKYSDFSEAFMNEMKIKSNSRSMNIFVDLVEQINNENLVIYTPYIEEFDWDTVQNITITFHPLIQDLTNSGISHDLSSNTNHEVIVDDDYAFSHPTIIIKPFEESLGSLSSYEQLDNGNARTLATINQLSVGWVKCTKQYDGIFSGGSEFKFCIIGGKITSLTGAAESFESIVSIDISRSDIRNGNWKKFYYELDDDWVSPEDSRKFGLIEFDKNKTKHELSFGAKVTKTTKDSSGTSSTFEFLPSYKITIESQEGWIKTDTYDSRTTYTAFNKTDMGQGLKDGYRIYSSGSVHWTLPLREFSN